MGWLGLVGYLVGAILVYRKTYIIVDNFNRTEFPSLQVGAADRAFGAFVGIAVGSMWPVFLGGWLVYRMLTPTTPGERKDDLDRREREIERLERDLGIK